MHNWTEDPRSSQTAESMICQLANLCDGASSWDGSGFSKFDASFGHSLASRASNGCAWSEKQASSALDLIRKYQAQLGGKEFINSWLEKPIFRCMPGEKAKGAARKLSSNGSSAIFAFTYDPSIVAAIKERTKGEHRGKKFWPSWDPSSRTWVVPVNETSIGMILGVANEFGFEIEERFHEYYRRVEEKIIEDRTMLTLNDGRHAVLANDEIIICIDDHAIAEEFRLLLAARS